MLLKEFHLRLQHLINSNIFRHFRKFFKVSGWEENGSCKDMDQFPEKGSGSRTLFWEQDWSRSYYCKLVNYQTQFSALVQGIFLKELSPCLKPKFLNLVELCNLYIFQTYIIWSWSIQHWIVKIWGRENQILWQELSWNFFENLRYFTFDLLFVDLFIHIFLYWCSPCFILLFNVLICLLRAKLWNYEIIC